MAKQSLVSISAQDDLINWEFINQSDFELESDDDDSIYEVQSIDFLDSISSSSDQEQHLPPAIDDDDDDVMGTSPPIHASNQVNFAKVLDLGHNFSDDVDDDDDDSVMESSPPIGSSVEVRVVDFGGSYSADVGYDDDEEEEEEEEEESDDGGDYGMDDELVPWGVTDKLERQRMRKLGKRTFAKMTKTKRSELIYARPGCVRGKHGLGLKAF